MVLIRAKSKECPFFQELVYDLQQGWASGVQTYAAASWRPITK